MSVIGVAIDNITLDAVLPKKVIHDEDSSSSKILIEVLVPSFIFIAIVGVIAIVIGNIEFSMKFPVIRKTRNEKKKLLEEKENEYNVVPMNRVGSYNVVAMNGS